MSKLTAFLGIMAAISSITFGHLYWQTKINLNSYPGQNNVQNKSEEHINEEISPLTIPNHLPSSFQIKMKQAYQNGESLHLVIYGSKFKDTESAWTTLFSKHLNKAYGKLFKLTVVSEDQHTISEVIELKAYNKINQLKPDILLLEPFTQNNHKVSIENITTLIKEIKKENPEIYVFLQFPHPSYKNKYDVYNAEQLKILAKDNGYTFIDHWEGWMKYNDPKIKPYSTEANNLWADSLVNYFIERK